MRWVYGRLLYSSTLKNNALKDISHGYKANKVNRRIFESSGDLGVPKVTKRPLTVPKSPNLSKRAPTPVRTSTPLGSISSNQHQQHHRQQQQQKQQERNSAVKKTHVVTQHGLVSCAESARRLSAEKMKREEHQDVANADVDDQLQQEPEHVVEYEVPIRAETPEDQDTNEPLERARSMTPRHRETLHGPSMQRSRSQPPRHPDALRGSFMQRSRSQTPRHADALHGPPQRRARSQTPKPSLTVPIPFKFETDIRGERYQEQFRQRLEKWKEMEKESHHFKAHPRPVYPEKEEPKKSTKPLTQAQTIHLWTDDRARRREEFERERRMKEQLVQEMIAEKAREDELRQQQETRELRKQLVAHPVPIRHYQPIHIHRSTRPLTVPHSPNIGDKRKKQMMAEREAALAQEQAHQFDDQR
ncbi:Protein tpx2 [Mortierella sp. GBA43]|nr:Protein tpx2 [Mortierella sp. GBA43]